MTRSGIAIGIIQFLIVVGVISAAFFLSNALKPDQTQRQVADVGGAEAPLVEIAKPLVTSHTPRLMLNGVVETRARTALSPQVSGNVTQVADRFRGGSVVRRGDFLFQIDPADFELSVQRADAEIAAARSDLLLLEADAEIAIREWRALYPNEEPTDLAARKPQIAAAEARVKSAEASRKTAELALARTTVRAPFNGRVLSTSLEVGQFVSPQLSVGELYPTDAVEIAVTVSERQRHLLGAPIGRPVDILVGGSPEPLSGTIARIDATLDPRTRLGTLRIAVNDGDTLTLGSFVDIVVTGETVENSVSLPASSFTDQTTVWVVSGQTLQRRTVQPIEQQGDRTVVAAFDLGDGVVVLPPANAREGMTVTVRAQPAEGGVRNVSLKP